MRAWLKPLDGHGVAIARAGARVCDVNRRLNGIPAPTQSGQIDTTHSKKSVMFDRSSVRRNQKGVQICQNRSNARRRLGSWPTGGRDGAKTRAIANDFSLGEKTPPRRVLKDPGDGLGRLTGLADSA
jgi:hypothetical protein